ARLQHDRSPHRNVPRLSHSFPTRRSSDLGRSSKRCISPVNAASCSASPCSRKSTLRTLTGSPNLMVKAASQHCSPKSRLDRMPRSEEHTSELQSRENIVCRLLLEKKNRTH